MSVADPPGAVDPRAQAALDHAWRYFQLHASQRVTVFGFFVVASGLVFSGVASALSAEDWRVVLGVPGGLLIALLALVCHKLDQRCAFLVKRAEEAAAAAEGMVLPEAARLFAAEAGRRPRGSQWTYGRSFRLLFATAAIVGLSAGAACAVKAWTRLAGPTTDACRSHSRAERLDRSRAPAARSAGRDGPTPDPVARAGGQASGHAATSAVGGASAPGRGGGDPTGPGARGRVA